MVYIVAGATGVVGSEISKELASENEVLIIGRDEDKLSSLSKEIDAQYAVIDLNNTIEQREFSKIVPEDKEIKGLVNCIGSILIKPLHGTKVEEFDEVIKVNLFSSYYLLSSFARRMKNGSAIFFSSVAGTKGLSNHEAIAAAKASKVSKKYPQSIVIGADQLLHQDGTLFGKPKHRGEAEDQLRSLSGDDHFLTTAAVAWLNNQQIWSHEDRAMMSVRPLDEASIKSYLDSTFRKKY